VTMALVCLVSAPCAAGDLTELVAEAEAHRVALRYEQAVEVAQRALAMDPEDARLHALLGRCLLGARRNPEAIRALNEAIRLDPDAAEPYADLGHAKALGGNPKAGLLDCTKAIELDPDNAHYYGRRGLVRAGAGELDAGLEDLTRAIELSPNHELYAWRGWVLIRLGRNEEAIADLDLAIAAKPEWGEPYGSRGEALENLGRIHEAVASWDQALERLPTNHPFARVLRDWKARAKPALQPGVSEDNVVRAAAKLGFLIAVITLGVVWVVRTLRAPPTPLRRRRKTPGLADAQSEQEDSAQGGGPEDED
jgi:tetratricopeptide (TPR) repeat protein